ncbi:hypothetical protein Tco_1474683 [Tanacetum coccineum]
MLCHSQGTYEEDFWIDDAKEIREAIRTSWCSEGLEKDMIDSNNYFLNVDTLSIDDLYNNLRVFEQEIQGASKTSSSAQNVAFVSQSKSITNKFKSSSNSTYSTCTPTSSTNIPEKEALAGFADEDCYSKGNMMERRRETLFINTKKLEKQEKNQDGIADNG